MKAYGLENNNKRKLNKQEIKGVDAIGHRWNKSVYRIAKKSARRIAKIEVTNELGVI